MNKILIVFVIAIGVSYGAHATCPSGYTEIQMENAVLVDGDTCPNGTEEYYSIDNQCTADIYPGGE